MTDPPSDPVPPLPCPASGIDSFLSRPSPGVGEALAGAPGDVLVLGAGGKMGLHLCRMIAGAALEAGRPRRVLAVSRFGDPAVREAFDRAGIEARPLNLTATGAVESLPADGFGSVFFLAGFKFGSSARPDLLGAINEELPARVAEHFRAARIVALSSGCVYPFVAPASGGCTEADPPGPPDAYSRSCLGREEAFAAAAGRHGTRCTLVRLNYACEFRYGVLVDIAERVRAGRPVPLATGHVNVIWQRDAIDHIIRGLALAATGAPAVLNVTGPTVLAVKDLATRLGEHLGRPARFQGGPAPTAWLSDASRSHRLFGPPETPLEDMLRWTAAWLARGGETLGKPTHFWVRDGRF